MGLLLITRFTLQEAIRRRIFLAVVLLTVIMLIAYGWLLKAIIASYVPTMVSNGFYAQFALIAGGIFISIPSIWIVYLLSGIMTIFLAVGMISSEIEAGTFSIMVPKPLYRYEIVLGKWLGHAIILGAYVALLFLAFLGIIYGLTGYWPEQFLNALGMLELAMLALLGLATLGSTLVSTLVNGAVLLILFIGAPLASFISTFIAITGASQQARLPPPNATLQNIITVTNLLIPTDALWHQTSAYLIPLDTLNLLPTQGFSTAVFDIPILNPQDMTTALLIWTLLYCLVLPALAVWRFSRRDL